MHPLPLRSPGRIAVALLALAATLCLLAGCVPDPADPVATGTPTPAASPLFTSDEEALAAAEKVYRAYLEAVDRNALDELTDLATPETIETDRASGERLQADGLRAEGTTVLRSFTLQAFDRTDLTAYACLDVSGVRIRDSSGTDVTPEDRPSIGTLEVRFTLTENGFLVAESNLWSTSC